MIYNVTWLVALLIFLGAASDGASVRAAENSGGVVAEEMVIEDALSGDLKPDKAAQKDLEKTAAVEAVATNALPVEEPAINLAPAAADASVSNAIAGELGLAPDAAKDAAAKPDAPAGVDVAAELGITTPPGGATNADAAVAAELGLTAAQTPSVPESAKPAEPEEKVVAEPPAVDTGMGAVVAEELGMKAGEAKPSVEGAAPPAAEAPTVKIDEKPATEVPVAPPVPEAATTAPAETVAAPAPAVEPVVAPPVEAVVAPAPEVAPAVAVPASPAETVTAAAPPVEPATVPPVAVAAPAVAEPATPAEILSPDAIMLRESEQLRRRAFEQHAMEKLLQADAAFKEKRYAESKKLYKEARTALEQAGARAENKEAMTRAQNGYTESMYQQALYIWKQGDRETALKMAREASAEGHLRAPELVRAIEEALKPVVPQPKPPPPRWKADDYKAMEKQIADRLRQGREFFMSGELDKAKLAFESVLALDPTNSEAIRWREKVAIKRYSRATAETESTRRDMMTQVRKAWNPNNYNAEEFKGPELQTGGGRTRIAEEERRKAILDKMEKIIIPEVEFRQANINDVITFLQEQSVEWDKSTEGKKGVNIILNLGTANAPAAAPADALAPAGVSAPASGNEPALITFKARDISLLEALKIVTNVANLKYRVEGSVVLVVPFNAPIGPILNRMYDVLPNVGEKVRTISGEISAAGGKEGGSGGVIGIEAAPTQERSDWKEFFKELGVSWPDGSSIKYIPSIGKIMVANTADNLAIFEERLSALNIVPYQIEIETRFVEVNQTDLSSLGFEWLLTDNWELATSKSSKGRLPGARERIEVQSGAFSTGERYLTRDKPTDLNDASAPLSGVADNALTIASVLTNPQVAMIMHLLQQSGQADLLSAPKVTTQPGVQATIKVVTEYIYPTEFTVTGITQGGQFGGQTTTATTVEPGNFETREVGVILTVLPEVSAEGQIINLTMTPEVVTGPGWKNYGSVVTDPNTGQVTQQPMEQPIFNVRSINTTISIYNGSTVVMGGMITEKRGELDDRIPFLGDLPLVGRLFRSKAENSSKNNLLIFVTARLVDPAGRSVGKPSDIIRASAPAAPVTP